MKRQTSKFHMNAFEDQSFIGYPGIVIECEDENETYWQEDIIFLVSASQSVEDEEELHYYTRNEEEEYIVDILPTGGLFEETLNKLIKIHNLNIDEKAIKDFVNHINTF